VLRDHPSDLGGQLDLLLRSQTARITILAQIGFNSRVCISPEQEIELAAKIKKGDREARALMIRSNLRLVVKIAHDYANLGLPLLT